MPLELGRRLIAAGLVLPEDVEAALFLSVLRGIPFSRALLDRGSITDRALEDELDRRGDLPLRQVVAAPALVERLPPALCRRLAAVPIRLDTSTGVIDVAVVDPLDPHVAAELAFHLGAPIRVLRAPIAAIEEAIRRLELMDADGAAYEPARLRRLTPPFPHGAPESVGPNPPELPIPLTRYSDASALLGDDDGEDDDDFIPSLPDLPASAPMSAAATSEAHALPLVRTLFSPSNAPPGPSPDTRRSGPPTAKSGPFHAMFTMTQESSATPSRPLLADNADLDELEPSTRPSPSRLAAAFEDGPPSVSFPSNPPGPAADGEEPISVSDDEIISLADPEVPLSESTSARLPSAAFEPRPRALDRSTTNGAHASERTPGSDLGPVLASLRIADARDAVIELAIRGLELIAPRAAVFAVRKDSFRGWSCNAALGDPEALRQISIPQDQPSVFATAMATGSYLGPIPETPVHAPLLGVMGAATSDVAVVAAKVAGRPALLLLADGLEDAILDPRRMDELARAVGAALTRALEQR